MTADWPEAAAACQQPGLLLTAVAAVTQPGRLGAIYDFDVVLWKKCEVNIFTAIYHLRQV